MLYGDKFSHEVDAAKISSAGFPVQKFRGGYLVQVTEEINDVADDSLML